MRVYGQDSESLWDDAYTWECSLLSFCSLRRLLIRTSRSITPEETPSNESEGGLGCPKRLKEVLRPDSEDEFELELKLAHQCL